MQSGRHKEERIDVAGFAELQYNLCTFIPFEKPTLTLFLRRMENCYEY